ncbi:MAG: hypothetical protein ACK56F_07440, partial [bacterium]
MRRSAAPRPDRPRRRRRGRGDRPRGPAARAWRRARNGGPPAGRGRETQPCVGDWDLISCCGGSRSRPGRPSCDSATPIWPWERCGCTPWGSPPAVSSSAARPDPP